MPLILDGDGRRENNFVFFFWAHFLCQTSFQMKTMKFPLCFQFCIKELILAKQCYGRTEFKRILDARILQKVPSVFGSLEFLRHSAAVKYDRPV